MLEKAGVLFRSFVNCSSVLLGFVVFDLNLNLLLPSEFVWIFDVNECVYIYIFKLDIATALVIEVVIIAES